MQRATALVTRLLGAGVQSTDLHKTLGEKCFGSVLYNIYILIHFDAYMLKKKHAKCQIS